VTVTKREAGLAWAWARTNHLGTLAPRRPGSLPSAPHRRHALQGQARRLAQSGDRTGVLFGLSLLGIWFGSRFAMRRRCGADGAGGCAEWPSVSASSTPLAGSPAACPLPHGSTFKFKHEIIRYATAGTAVVFAILLMTAHPWILRPAPRVGAFDRFVAVRHVGEQERISHGDLVFCRILGVAVAHARSAASRR